MNELKLMIKENLDDKGALAEIQADFNDHVTSLVTNDKTRARPKPNPQNSIINELIREYLEFNAYHHTYDTFVQETRSSQFDPIDRKYICKYLKVIEDRNTQEIPLLYGNMIVAIHASFDRNGIRLQETAHSGVQLRL